MTAGAAQTCSVPFSSAIAAQYETLRLGGLGESLPPKARGSFMLFLSRGMWGWACTLAAAPDVREDRAHRPLPDGVSPPSREAIVHVLAALAIVTPYRRVS